VPAAPGLRVTLGAAACGEGLGGGITKANLHCSVKIFRGTVGQCLLSGCPPNESCGFRCTRRITGFSGRRRTSHPVRERHRGLGLQPEPLGEYPYLMGQRPFLHHGGLYLHFQKKGINGQLKRAIITITPTTTHSKFRTAISSGPAGNIGISRPI